VIPLGLHTHYSLLRSTISCDALCKRAKILGYNTIALTDSNNLYGLWNFINACKRYEIRPIIGAEIRAANRRAFCLVKNSQGYKNLCQLITARHCEKNFSLATVAADRLQGLILLTDDSSLLTQWRAQELDTGAAIINRPTQHNSALRRLARQLDITAVLLTDIFFLRPQDRSTHHLLRAIACNTSLSRLPVNEQNTRDCYLAEKQEYRHRFQVWPEVIRNTQAIAEQCAFQGPEFGLVLPPYNNVSPEKAHILLQQAAFDGAEKRYGMPLPVQVKDRLKYELRIIAGMGFSSYFLVVRDIVRPVSRTCGRGSGAASLVAYCLFITNVCPLRHNLYFERFLHPGRRDAPDIDIDFAWDERNRVLNAVFTQYECRAAMVCNQVSMRPRRAIRETAKVFGIPAAEISVITDRLSGFRFNQATNGNLLSQLQAAPRLRRCFFDHPWPEILHQAEKIIGTPANLSVHPGGVIITPDPVSDYVPVEKAAKGVPVIQWEKDGAEQAGLVKIDLLGNRSLGVIRDALAEVRANGVDINTDRWLPEDDADTRKLIKTGKTMGCFYIESPAMRLLQKKAGRGDFEHLVIHSSIIRPAANDCIREYLRRLHGGSWQPLHPLIADILDETYGIMVYQEDVSRVAVQLGFSSAQGDRLRKIMSGKDKKRQLADYQTRFFAAAAEKKVSAQAAETLWQMMLSFEGYSFCKPHSASYARVSFQAAYLKAHFPAEFMAAVISNQGGYYSTFAYLSEARRLGLQVLPPDVNTSEIQWCGGKGKLRVGLMAIRGLSDDTSKKILRERKTGGMRQGQKKFLSVLDFLQKIRPADDEARALIHAGALDGLEKTGNRAGILYQLAHWQQTHSQAVARQLFAPRLVPPDLPPENPLHRLRNEYRVLGFLCSTHPIRLFDTHRKQLQTILACNLAEFNSKEKKQKIRFLGWPVAGKIVGTKSGRPMEFLSFEDETDQLECTVFPETYRRYCHLLHGKAPLVLSGIVERDFGVLTLRVDHVASVPTRGKCVTCPADSNHPR
jgi:DNA polymerase-3 subunit alpha/error-prone DNA polymerase